MKFIAILFLLGLSMSCQKTSVLKSSGTVIHVEDALGASVATNAESPSHSDWHSADTNPEKLFAHFLSEIQQNKMESKDVCIGLLKMKDEELVIFEGEITKTENKPVIDFCESTVLARLDDYWVKQRSDIKVETAKARGSDPIIPLGVDIELRDVSQGYSTTNGDLKAKQVLLTFDDGPHPTNTRLVLETLKKANVRAVFFNLGRNVRKYPQLVKREALAGHSIGSHSDNHACLSNRSICGKTNGGNVLSFPQALANIRLGHQAIFDVLGWVDPFFRFPYGEASIELKSYLRRNGVGEFYWSVDSEDWRDKLADGRANTAVVMVESVMAQLRSRGGKGIVLFHDIHRKTAEALPLMLTRLQAEGYRPVIFQAKDPQARFNSRLVGPRKELP